MDPLMIAAMIASLAKGIMQIGSAGAQEGALREQSRNDELQYLQQSNSRLFQLQSLLSTQTATESARGVGLGSPSFEAIQSQSVRISGKQQRNLDTEEAARQHILQTQRSNVKSTLFAQLFGDVGTTAIQTALLTNPGAAGAGTKGAGATSSLLGGLT